VELPEDVADDPEVLLLRAEIEVLEKKLLESED
jgi:hypothetical protein